MLYIVFFCFDGNDDVVNIEVSELKPKYFEIIFCNIFFRLGSVTCDVSVGGSFKIQKERGLRLI